MTLWIDAQLSPALARWLGLTFDVSAIALRDIGMRDATDREIFFAARRARATIMTKDIDFFACLKILVPRRRLSGLLAEILQTQT
jgi:predicted nuclease of predicted toxin-antitoxin system